MSIGTMLVTGATGNTGAAAVRTLLALGKPVRALVRKDDERAAELRSRGVEIAVGDLDDMDGVRAALEGVSSAYFIYPIQPGIIPATAYFAQAAKEAGVGAIVNMSQKSARREATSHAARDHWIAERVFDWSAIPVTHLRPTFFAEWLAYPWFARAIWKTKTIQLPFAHGRHAPIAAEDQGRLVGHIMADPEPHAGKVYPLYGPVEMDHDGIAAAVGEALGTTISYDPIEVAEFRRRMEEDFQFPPFLVQHLVEVSGDYRSGIFAGTNDVIERITGQAPMTVGAFVSRHRDAFA